MVTTYEIWRVQTFYNSNNSYTKYNKIYDVGFRNFYYYQYEYN